ncbi:PaaI family thioesterase [Effusibacillus lacus]|uniref:Thioesterase domain-containing protein n=1 Tax=Effusibacillus lacus TaxID=1348429 RepID=A0A292YE96_9BACL|nr:PaaI family thioesterase [Effusibacillus lacus]TCS76933.1 acyl-CoA thioesterase [Effusibacillus lacus]GAX91262.1 hypothetical protein EFBL_2928 [Effusibacillus lacus]
MFIKQPFDEFLGLQYERVSDNRVKIRLPLKPLFINSLGYVHGGIISSLADVAMSNILQPDENGIQTAVTVDLKTSFLKPAQGTVLVADAHTFKIGKNLMHAECHIFDDQNEIVAKSNGIFFRIKEK